MNKQPQCGGSTSRSKHLLALVDALDNYIRILGNELNDCVTIAHVHGWRSTRVAEGEKMRREIAALRHKANAPAHGEPIGDTVVPDVGLPKG
jgi:hypothetical protein